MKRILIIMAHPDDETFSVGGTIAKYVKAGSEVSLLCATRGEAGASGGRSVKTGELAEIRLQSSKHRAKF